MFWIYIALRRGYVLGLIYLEGINKDTKPSVVFFLTHHQQHFASRRVHAHQTLYYNHSSTSLIVFILSIWSLGQHISLSVMTHMHLLPFNTATVDLVMQNIKNINHRKATGFDNIHKSD